MTHALFVLLLDKPKAAETFIGKVVTVPRRQQVLRPKRGYTK